MSHVHNHASIYSLKKLQLSKVGKIMIWFVKINLKKVEWDLDQPSCSTVSCASNHYIKFFFIEQMHNLKLNFSLKTLIKMAPCRMLPQRPPPMLRGNSTEARSLRSSPVAQRRISYQRSSSTAMRRLPRQGSTEVHRVLPNPRTFRRYGEQSDSERQSLMALVDEYQSAERRMPQQPLQETPVSKGEKRVRWGRATFQRSTSLETPPVDFSRQRLMLVRQDSVAGSSSLPDKLEERSSDNSYK